MGPTNPVESPGPWEQMRFNYMGQRNDRKAGKNVDQKVQKRSEHSLVTSHTGQARWKAVVAVYQLEQGKVELLGCSGSEAGAALHTSLRWERAKGSWVDTADWFCGKP